MNDAARILVSLLILTFSVSATFAQQSVTPLEPGKPIDKTIAAGETHSYTLTLPSGIYGLLRVDQKGTNLAVSVLSVDGQKLRNADLDGPGIPEQLSLLATEATQFRIEVTIAGRPGKTHGYSITLSDVRPATGQDRARVEGEKLLEDGMSLLYEQSAQSAKAEAVIKFQQAVNFFR